MRKILALIMALAMLFSLQTVAFAAGTNEAEVKGTYKAVQTQTVYTVDFAWSGLDFTYTETTTWDATNHKYVVTDDWSGEGTITLTNHTDKAITATPAYEKASGFGDAGMAFYDGDAEITSLQIASAAPAAGQSQGSAQNGTITVKPTGSLPQAATTKTTIGQITVTIS